MQLASYAPHPNGWKTKKVPLDEIMIGIQANRKTNNGSEKLIKMKYLTLEIFKILKDRVLLENERFENGSIKWIFKPLISIFSFSYDCITFACRRANTEVEDAEDEE